MSKYVLSEEQRNAVLELLSRTKLEGKEVPAFNEILRVLNTPVVEPGQEEPATPEVMPAQ